MSEKIAVIGDPAVATGFRLAGVAHVYATPRGKEFENKLNEVIANPEVGLVIVNESYLSGIDRRLKKKIDGLSRPVVIWVADISGETMDEDLGGLIKRALGFDVYKK